MPSAPSARAAANLKGNITQRLIRQNVFIRTKNKKAKCA